MNTFLSFLKSFPRSACAILCLLALGCQLPEPKTGPGSPAASLSGNNTPDNSIVLREGDTLKVTFPEASKLDSLQQIRRDGKIVLPVFGELTAVNLTPAQLEKQIVQQFGSQLVSKEVTVTLESSQFSVFVNGAILRPGKITSNRPITALEAIMEAGGFDYAKANLKAVKVIRTEGSEVKNFSLDFRGVLQGKSSDPFYVKPSDIIYVPEKFTLF